MLTPWITTIVVLNIFIAVMFFLYFDYKMNKIRETFFWANMDLKLEKKFLRSTLIKDKLQNFFGTSFNPKKVITINGKTTLLQNAIDDLAESDVHYKEATMTLTSALLLKEPPKQG
jgi:hypothetical protein